jgi:hypothetical protein
MRTALVLSLVLLAAPLAANAAGITVPIDQSRRLSIGGQAASVVVGNKEIADVRAIDTRTLMVVGKKQGVTNVVVFDATGRTLYDGEIIVSAPNGSMVTVYRGAQAVEYACSPYCQSSAPERDTVPATSTAPITTMAAPPPGAPASAPGGSSTN